MTFTKVPFSELEPHCAKTVIPKIRANCECYVASSTTKLIEKGMSDSDKKMDEDVKHVEEEEDEKKETGTALSHTRVRRIIKSDPDTKQIANDAVYLISRATVRLPRLLCVFKRLSCFIGLF